MSRLLNLSVVLVVMLCFILAPAASAQVVEILPVGGAISGRFGAQQAQVEYTLDIPAGELVTLTISRQMDSDASASSLTYDLTDANGAPVHLIPPSYAVFRADGALPYTFSLEGVNASFTVQLEAGNAHLNDRGMVSLNSQISEQVIDQQYDAYTLDAEPGSLITVRYTDTHFAAFLYGLTPATEQSGDGWIAPTLMTAQQTEVEPFSSAYRKVYRLTGEPPYMLFVAASQSEPGEIVPYEIQLEAGDTLEREQLGTLAPGEKLEGMLPDEDGIYYTIRLDVEAGKTYSVRQWSEAGVRFIVMDGNVMQVSDGSPTAALSQMRFTVDETYVLPLYLMIEVTEQNAGTPFTFTLAEGTDPLPPEAATSANLIESPEATAQAEAVERTQVNPERDATPEAAAEACLLTIPGGGMINQRAEPSTNAALVGRMAGTGSFTVDGQTRGADGVRWWRLSEGIWVRGDVVSKTGDCESVPVIQS